MRLLALALVAGNLVLPVAATGYNQVTNGTFDTTSAPWVAYGGSSGRLRVTDGRACVDTGSGTLNPWDSELALPICGSRTG